MSAPPVQLLGSSVLVQGSAVPALRYAVYAAINVRRINGLPPTPTLTQLAEVLMTAEGRQDVPDIEQRAVSEPQAHEQISIEEAAQMLGLSARQTRRRACEFGGRIIGGRWLLDRHSVTDYCTRKES